MSFIDKIKRGRGKPIPMPVDEPLSSPTPAPRASPTPLGTLPAWATIAPSASKGIGAVVEVDSAQAYPYWLSLLGVSTPDQYWLEVAYQCIKLDVQSALVGTENDPRTLGKPVQINFARAEAFAQKAHPPGRGASLATQGREARTHYVRVRGRMPF
jgi:hypothetical protein